MSLIFTLNFAKNTLHCAKNKHLPSFLIRYLFIIAVIKVIYESTSMIISQSRSNPAVDAFLVIPHNPTFLRENARYFRSVAELSLTVKKFNVFFRHGLQDAISVETSC